MVFSKSVSIVVSVQLSSDRRWSSLSERLEGRHFLCSLMSLCNPSKISRQYILDKRGEGGVFLNFCDRCLVAFLLLLFNVVVFID